MMKSLHEQLTRIMQGDVYSDDKTLDFYSHDASMLELRPQLVVHPKNTADIAELVSFIAKEKLKHPELSLTARSGGTCMSGGSINESIIVDFSKYFTAIKKVDFDSARVEPGVFYRNFEPKTLKHGAIMPSYPASRDLCTVGGMINNNAGGEKSLQYGKTENFVQELEVVFADGKQYTVKPLNKAELNEKMRQDNYEGHIYKRVYELIEKHYDTIKSAQPNVSKDSTGYHLWRVWDREAEIFDLTQLIVGAQGTLGFVTDIKFRLVPAPKHSGTLVIFLRETDDLGDIINDVLDKKPATFEGFDNYTLILSFKLFFYFRKTLGWLGMAKLGIQLIPDALMLFRGIPKMVLLIEFNADKPEEVASKVHQLKLDLKRKYKHEALFEEDETEAKVRKFWIMRRESFNLLRKKVRDKHTAPFIDDLVVPPEHLPTFLPEVRAIIKKYKLLATIAGHMGDGNFHIIPLMEIEKKEERDKLEPAMKEVNNLVLRYGGSLSGEHNDGMIRGSWLEAMYGPEMLSIFKEVKHIFDPQNIFNPHKKTDADWDYTFSNVRKSF